MPGEKEMINNLIDTYSNLQQIKQANGDHKNQVLDYLIKVTRKVKRKRSVIHVSGNSKAGII